MPNKSGETATDNNKQPLEEIMIVTFRRIALAVGLMAVASPALAQTKIGVSYQPSLYWALPFHYANVKGWDNRKEADWLASHVSMEQRRGQNVR